MRQRGKKTIIAVIIIMNNYDNKDDKIRWWYIYRIKKLMAKSEKDKIC